MRQGSVTVFFSLVGILIVALLGTLVETARYTACAQHGKRTLQMGCDALLTEYSKPLYDRYRLFAIEDTGETFESVIARYMNSTFEEKQGYMNFFQGSVDEVAVTDKQYLGDDNAKDLQEQINAYMKCEIVKGQQKETVEKWKPNQKSEELAKKTEEDIEQLQKEASLDTELLKLMDYVDGIVLVRGKIQCKKKFVKMFFRKGSSAAEYGVLDPKVWKKMKKCQIKMEEMPTATQLGQALKVTKKAIEQRKSLEEKYQKIAGTSKNQQHTQYISRLIQQLSVLESNYDILEKILKISKMKGDHKDELLELWEGYDTKTIAFDYRGIHKSGGEKNPIECFGESWKKGIISLVLQQPEKVSKKGVPASRYFENLYKDAEKTEDLTENKIEKFVSNKEVGLSGTIGDIAATTADTYFLSEYGKKHFSHYGQDKMAETPALLYEWEYFVAGKKTDKENLSAVLNRIMLSRTPINLAAIAQDSGKQTQAYSIAAAVVGFSGMEPLIRLTQSLILITWALVESMIDVAAMLQGKKVPVLKGEAHITASLQDVLSLSHATIMNKAKQVKNVKKAGMDYKDYLQMFAAMKNNSICRYRIMDCIQWNMQKNVRSHFQLQTCVSSIKTKAGFRFNSKFLRFPSVEEMLNRRIGEVTTSARVCGDYLS